MKWNSNRNQSLIQEPEPLFVPAFAGPLPPREIPFPKNRNPLIKEISNKKGIPKNAR